MLKASLKCVNLRTYRKVKNKLVSQVMTVHKGKDRFDCHIQCNHKNFRITGQCAEDQKDQGISIEYPSKTESKRFDREAYIDFPYPPEKFEMFVEKNSDQIILTFIKKVSSKQKNSISYQDKF